MAYAPPSRSQQRKDWSAETRIGLLEQDADEFERRQSSIDEKLNRILFAVLAVALTLAGNLALILVKSAFSAPITH